MKPSEITFQIKTFKFDVEINIFCPCFLSHQPTINLSKHFFNENKSWKKIVCVGKLTLQNMVILKSFNEIIKRQDFFLARFFLP